MGWTRLTEVHKCSYLKVGLGIPYVHEELLELEKILGRKTRKIVLDALTNNCDEDCEGPDILYCFECRSIKKVG